MYTQSKAMLIGIHKKQKTHMQVFLSPSLCSLQLPPDDTRNAYMHAPCITRS